MNFQQRQQQSSSRQNKLRALQEREAAKVRMGRLQMMLQQKLIQKYGDKRNPNSRLNTEINDAVQEFIAQTSTSAKVSNEDFLELENKALELRAKYRKNAAASGVVADWRVSTASSDRIGGSFFGKNGSTTESDAKSQASGGYCCDKKGGGHSCGRTGVDASDDCNAGVSSERLSSAGDARGAGGNQDETLPPSVARVWRTFDVTKQIEFEKKERQKAHKARQEKTRFREELNIYRSQKERQKAKEEEERRRENAMSRKKQMEETEKNLAQFREEQDATKRRAAERHAEEKAQRQEQIKRKQVEREQEKYAQLDRERRDIEQCMQQLKSEEDKLERRRVEEKKWLGSIKEEGVRKREMRAQEQRELNELDSRLVKEHLRKLEEDERKRAEMTRNRMKRHEDIGDFWERHGAGRENKDLKKREEQRILEAARRIEEAQLERERQEAEKRRLAIIAIATENKKVIAEKNATREKAQREDMELARRFVSDSEAFIREERDKIATKKATTVRYREDLERQVEEIKARRLQAEMNDTEFRLNSDIVKKLESDKELVTEVKQRMESARGLDTHDGRKTRREPGQ